MFDVSSLDTRARSETGMPMQILHPKTGLPILDDAAKPVTISLLGPNSVVSKQKQRELQLRRADMQTRNISLDDDFFQRERFEFLSTVTVAWTFDKMDGQDFPCNADNIAKFWADERWNWVSIQAFNFAQSQGNYLPL